MADARMDASMAADVALGPRHKGAPWRSWRSCHVREESSGEKREGSSRVSQQSACCHAVPLLHLESGDGLCPTAYCIAGLVHVWGGAWHDRMAHTRARTGELPYIPVRARVIPVRAPGPCAVGGVVT